MIFVMVGTNEAPFDRLLGALDRLPPGEALVVQHGASSIRPRRARCFDFLPFEQVVEYVREARAVVIHAGVGSVIVALANGRRPLVVPRLRRFGEAVDDHQLPFARRLESAGLVTLVTDPDRLGETLANVPPLAYPSGEPEIRLVRELRAYLIERLGDPRSPPAVGRSKPSS